jgi:hypothetical protein
MKIARLTPEQEGSLAGFVEYGIRHGLSCEPCNRELAAKAARAHYVACGMDEPRLIIWLDSPLEGAIGAAILAGSKISGQQVGDQVRQQVWQQVGQQVWQQVRDQIGQQVRDQVGQQVRDQVGQQVRDQVRDQVRQQVRDQVGQQVRQQVRDQVGQQVGQQVGDQVRDQVWQQVGQQVWQQVGQQVRDQVWQQVFNASYGAHDMAWVAWFEAMRSIGVDLPPTSVTMSALCKEVGWWWPFERAAILTDRPCLIKQDDEHALHCEDGPAVQYRDGFSVFSWHGTRIPARWVLNRETIDPSEILQERNVDVMNAGLQCIGLHKIKKTHGRLIHDSGNPVTGALWELRLPNFPVPGLFLSAMCPRNGEIFEGVMPISNIDGLPIRTAEAAQAWRRRLPACEFEPSPYRT